MVNLINDRLLEIQKNEMRVFQNMSTVCKESRRVASIAQHSGKILSDLEAEFTYKTKLDNLDMNFLFFAVALQCVRQYLLSNHQLRFGSDQEAGKFIKKVVPISLQGPVPYDAFRKADTFDQNTGISGANHRYTTLGHDPLLGWIFGTANIITETVTKNNWALESYYTVLKNGHYVITGPTNIISIFSNAYHSASADSKVLIMAVLKHAIHLSSDAFTKMGLPLPFINSLSPQLSGFLMQNGIDTYSVTRGAALATLINSLIAAIHSLYYDPNKYSKYSLYEVKTRKILSYSNAIASGSNILYCAITGDLSRLDLGGLLVTLYRLVTDYQFIMQIKEEFVFGEFDRMIMGTPYDF